MRAKRPYLYSDSASTDAYRLSRSELSHHLDTLTDRNQHKDFENFARRLCEREICPNLRPQTGPEGGGDGKVDTETYPVDDKIAERWFVGDRSDGQAKWGFAFSAKKDWANKVRSDVEGIIGTNRGYEKIFFVTSRPTRAKDRLRVEDELRSAHGVSVTILDREWILDRVFSHGHKDLVFECLAAGEHDPNSVKLGPNDFKNQQALTEIEQALARMGDTQSDYIQAVSDTYEAATLSRRLERPRYETEGRFQRAIEFAKYGANYQHLRAIYQLAWTRFWWFDDVEAAQDLYEQVEEIAFATGHAEHISKVCNLHQLIVGQVLHGFQDSESLKLPERSSRLKAKLVALAGDKTRPNNALYAEALLWLFRLNENALGGNRDNFDDIWVGLSSVIDRAAGLGEFPAEMLDSVVEALSLLAPDSAEFDKLVEKLAEFMAERSKELKAARIYLSQGERKLDAEKPIESIKFLGRSVVNFMKEESREEQGRALYCLAVGYRGAGLLWAARGAAMGAITQVCAQAERDGEISVEAVPTFSLFTMIALQLGHVADFLSGIQFLYAAKNVLPLDDASRERLSKKIVEFDHLLSCLLSVVSTDDITPLTELPDILEALHLFTARMVLLYRLGHLDKLKSDGSIPEGTKDSDIHDMMSMIAAQPASRDLPKHIVLLGSDHSKIETRIMGINFQVIAEGNRNGLLLAEAHISFLEAFLSTLLNSEAFAHREGLQVEIMQSGSSTEARIEFSATGGKLTVTLPDSWNPSEVDNHRELNEHLVEFGIRVLANCIILPAHEKVLEQLLGIERAFERATLFCRTGMSRNRALGNDVGQIADWRHLVEKTYAFQNDAPDIKPRKLPEQPGDEKVGIGLGELNSHRDLAVSSIINQSLWDKAGWQGMMYGYVGPNQPPLLGLIFSSPEMANAIFEEWQDRFGREDANEEIRISIVKGIDRKNPYYYRGCISRDMDAIAKDDARRFVSVARMTTMTVSDHKNLELFQRAFTTQGCYFLLPTIFNGEGKPQLLPERAILKRKLNVREAWQIGRHDLDSMAVTPKDDVIIPNGEESPPIHELFEWRREMESRQE